MISPKEEGKKSNKLITGYEFTGKTITDKEGNTIASQEEGRMPDKSIPGYEYVRTVVVVDDNGSTTHVYRKVLDQPILSNKEIFGKDQQGQSNYVKIKKLPKTGRFSSSNGLLDEALFATMIAALFGFFAKRRCKED